MHWRDEGIILSVRPHGEHSAVVHLLTRDRGRHAGLARGALGSRQRGLFQPGNLVAATWSGRLAEHLGNYSCEAIEAYAARVLDDADRLAALSAAAAVCERALPEREPHPPCYDGLRALLEALTGPHWAAVYVRWELALLAELGFGLDLTACAAGGDNDRLAYVSPRSGRAVSLAAGAPYRDRLLALPGFLVGRGDDGPGEIGAGLALTGFFLERHVFAPHHQPLPPARRRLAERFPATLSAAG
jgi:DNA repair protein RecO (recombination protein O)